MNKKEVEKQLKDYPMALTVKEAAEILRVSTKLIYRMIREKKLPGDEGRAGKTNCQVSFDPLSSGKRAAEFEPKMCSF